MHAEELKLQQALVSQVRYDSSEDDVQPLKGAAAAQVNIDGQKVKELLYVVAATVEVRQFG